MEKIVKVISQNEKKKKRENKRPNSSTFQLERTKKMEQRKGME